MILTKEERIKYLEKHPPPTCEEVERYIRKWDELEDYEKGENVYLRGFGSFILKRRAEKTARNISKNTTIIIPAHNIPAFKPAKEFMGQVSKLKD